MNRTADEAFLAVLDGEAAVGLDDVVAGAYRAEATRRATVLGRTATALPEPDPPGPNWTFRSASTEREYAVVERSSDPTPAARAVADERRTVAVRHRVTRRWGRDGTVRETTAVRTTRYRVRVVVDVRYDPAGLPGPGRPTDPVFVRGGAVDGPNLADVPREARGTLLSDGGADRAALAAVRGGGGVEQRTVAGTPPEELRDWIQADLAGLRDRVRDVSVAVPRDAVAAGTANAPARLAATLRDRRAALVDAPAAYDGAADRARVAARAAYLDAVIATLTARADAAGRRNDAYRDRVGGLRSAADGGLDDLARIAARGTAPEPSPVGEWHAGEVTFTPRTTPGYLPVAAVDATHVDSVEPGTSGHPLVARNTNLFALPTGDAADTVTDAVLPTRRTASLARAGRVLVAGDDATGSRAATEGTAPPCDAASPRRSRRSRPARRRCSSRRRPSHGGSASRPSIGPRHGGPLPAVGSVRR
ncbi:hypothetical protein ACFQRB_09545 [Halobaculum litoreum]|uniref:Uncharacterized protein n=1 Tax=Halobaculum litoreum TaxID=3031998 RepID=A0ABD5XNH3_9EURY|nr:hypothetical protein [Halobaculum sp. DT92]